MPLTLAAILFGLGLYGVLARRNAVLVLMAVELMLNAVTLLFVTFDVTLAATGAAADRTGQVAGLFVIVLAAAEIGVGLAVVLALYRVRRTVSVDELRDEAGATPAGRTPSPGGSGAG